MSALLEESFEAPLAPPTLAGGAPPPPIPTYASSRDVRGAKIAVLVQEFDDRIFVSVSQGGKVGCLTQATLPPVHPLQPPPTDVPATTALSALPPPPIATTLTPLLGSPPNAILHDIYVSQIATLVWWSLQIAGAPRRPVVVGVSMPLKKKNEEGDQEGEGEGVSEKDREVFGAVMDMVAAWPGPGSASG